jgi:hypothetical protein
MANQEQATEQVQEQTNQGQAVQQDQETIEQKIEKAIRSYESEAVKKLKDQISGLDRKNSELEKARRDAELAQLPVQEQYEARLKELEERDAMVAQKEKAIARKEIVDQMAKKYKLTDKLAERIIGDSAAEIELDAKYLSDFVAQEVQTTATKTINEKLSGTPPVGGASAVLTKIQQLEQGLKAAKQNGQDEVAMQYEVAILEAKQKE